jgi:hypothetical protein
MQPIPTGQPRHFVREYASSREFRKDAHALYVATGYTVWKASGLAHQGRAMRALSFFWRRPEHVVITYEAPPNPHPAAADTC